MTDAPVTLVQPGRPAPDFRLPAIGREGTAALADYRGRSPLLLALFRGLWCPFCRRAVAELGATAARLAAAGVETLAVVATSVENARLYYRHRPVRVPLAADPECHTHRAYGLPKVALTPEVLGQLALTRINPTGELPEPLPVLEAARELDRRERFQPSAADQADYERQAGLLKGQFLVDRDGVVRWVNVEGAREGLPGFGKFPAADELLAAARDLA
jgi:peroxiredoxin